MTLEIDDIAAHLRAPSALEMETGLTPVLHIPARFVAVDRFVAISPECRTCIVDVTSRAVSSRLLDSVNLHRFLICCRRISFMGRRARQPDDDAQLVSGFR